MLLFLCGCRTKKSDEKETVYQKISSQEAQKLMDERDDLIILDVRRQDEYAEGHIPDAICIANEDIDGSVSEILKDKDQLILVYCRSGRRSKEACEKLISLGYTNIIDFGGILDWTGEVVTD